jgi:hypothetical protein
MLIFRMDANVILKNEDYSVWRIVSNFVIVKSKSPTCVFGYILYMLLNF